jgi:probable HAF family extracellular repeat protein
VNDQGQIVGVIEERLSSDPDVTRARPFLWQDGSLTMLPTLGGAGTGYSVRVSSVNNSGWIVGRLDLPSEEGVGEDEMPVERAVVWKDGQVIELETLGGHESGANGVNDQGQIVGWSQTADDNEHACIWEDGAVRDLNDLLPATLEVTLWFGYEINEEGVILCRTVENYLTGNFVLLIPSEE